MAFQDRSSRLEPDPVLVFRCGLRGADQVNANGTSDKNSSQRGSGGGCASSDTIAATYTVASNGRALVSQGGTQVGIMYIISTSQTVFLPTKDTNPQLTDFRK